jgi:hypothetical protein
MIASKLWSAFAVAVVAVVGVVATLDTPPGHVSRPVRAGVAPVLTTAFVCPSVGGGPGGGTTDMTVAHVTAGAAPTAAYVPVLPGSAGKRPTALSLRPKALLHKDSPYGPVSVAATGPGADGVVVSQTSLISTGVGRGLYDLSCLPPATDTWLVGSDGRIGFTDLLFLVNPSDALTNVALTFWSSKGPLSPPNTSGISLPAHSALVRRVSDFAPDIAGVAMHVHANSGTVSASIVDLQSAGTQPRGSDWIPPSAPPARSVVVTGFMPGATVDRLQLVNPSGSDATVSLRLLTPTKNFVPAGYPSVIVPAGHTVTVDLSGSISGEAAAALISSDTPVTAAGLTVQQPTAGFPDLAWLPAQQPLRSPAGIANNVPPFGQKVSLVVTAPAAAARLRVTSASGATAVVSVPGGRTVDVDLPALLHVGAGGPGPLLLSPLDAPVYVERTMYAVGAHGPLLAAGAPVTLPRAISLPPVVADLRAALP